MKAHKFLALCLIAIACTLSGCASSNLRRADEMSFVRRGIVTDVKEVTLAGTASGIGASAGSIFGTAIGGNRFSGSGDFKTAIVGALIGSVIGTVVGNEIEKKVTQASGIELTIKLDDGGEVAIPQRREAVEGIRTGDRVRVITNGPTAKVEKSNT